ncbi:MFS transporter [Altererythrobacter sp. BO-6]|uniref:NnrU family protein n=1 Tax=Altererythrobacter sp. BO-6 TaxID=2604537 RepID=UPI0013E16DEA|nr:NnrU family protein [Altererythrobacter sp. BO-6]QIG54128.1 MFS transporter [Altererythrobacter sp. BO-6]
MDNTIVELVAANVAFVGSHFAMSHPLRAPMVKLLREGGFSLAYTAVSFATFYWVYAAYTAAPSADLGGSGEIGWIAATLLTLPALVLFAGSFAGNPAMPTPAAEKQARAEPKGVFRVTRHPMMWGFGMWALSHIVLWWNLRGVITALAMGFLALVGAHLQDRKKRALMGEAWAEWESRTSYWPRWSKLASAGAFPWVAGLALWAGLSWAHLLLGGIPAGVWRWF